MPASCEYAKMITSPEGDGAIYIGSNCKTVTDDFFDNVFYRLNHRTNGSIEWVTLNQTFKYPRQLPVMDYIDESKVNCHTKTTTTVNPITTTMTTTTVSPAVKGETKFEGITLVRCKYTKALLAQP